MAELLTHAKRAVSLRKTPEAVALDGVELLPLVDRKESRRDEDGDMREQRKRDERETRRRGSAVNELAYATQHDEPLSLGQRGRGEGEHCGLLSARSARQRLAKRSFQPRQALED